MHVQIHQLAGGIMFSFRFVMIQSDPTTTRVTVAAIYARVEFMRALILCALTPSRSR